jgi:hypothetical protein
MSRVVRDIYSYSSLVSSGFDRANFRVTAKSPAREFGFKWLTDNSPKRQAVHTAPLAASRTWVSGSISQGLEKSQQRFLLSFAQIAESPDDMFSLSLVSLDGVLQCE